MNEEYIRIYTMRKADRSYYAPRAWSARLFRFEVVDGAVYIVPREGPSYLSYAVYVKAKGTWDYVAVGE